MRELWRAPRSKRFYFPELPSLIARFRFSRRPADFSLSKIRPDCFTPSFPVNGQPDDPTQPSASTAADDPARLAEQALLDHFTPASVVVDPDDHVVYFHGKTERFLDRPCGESTRELWSLVREPLRDGVRTALCLVKTEGGRGTARAAATEEPGNRHRVEIIARKLATNHRGHYVLLSFREIVEAPPISDAPVPDGAAESNRHNEQRHRPIRDRITDYAIFLIDVSGRIATWPPGAQRIFGYSPAAAIGRTSASLFTEQDRASGVPERELSLARTSSVVADAWQVRNDGTQFWGAGTLSPLLDATGRIEGFVKVLRDETKQKLNAAALDRAQCEAEAANTAKNNFLAHVAHELRTPLAPMMLWAHLLAREGEPDRALLLEGLGMIRQCAEELHELIENLVDTSRIVTGKLRLDLRPTDLASLVQASLDLAKPLAVSKGLALDAALDSTVGTVLADPARLQQVIANLLNNAVKFTPAGGRISLQLRRDAESVEIRVTDSGIGITPEFLPRVFLRFGQMEDSTKCVASGLGLGLSIARQLVELHHGTLTAQSDGPGRGATFSVRLPCAPLPSPDLPSKREAAARASPAEDLGGWQILIVEDTDDSRRALTLILAMAGADVVATASAAEALEEFQRQRPDIILSDIGMPEMTGHELIRMIRDWEAAMKLPRVPALALTAYADEENQRRARASGFDDCVTKPIDQRQLLAALGKIKATRTDLNGARAT